MIKPNFHKNTIDFLIRPVMYGINMYVCIYEDIYIYIYIYTNVINTNVNIC